MDKDVVVEIENLTKTYRLGTIGGQTLSDDLKLFWAKLQKKDNPLAKIGENTNFENEKREFNALEGISLKIRKGEAVGIIGHNGAGKSTLLKILSRVTVPTEGKVSMRGRVASMLEVGTGFHPELTGRENIYMNGAILGMSRSEVDSKIEEIIDFSECRQFIDTPVKRYSSGMYVKLAFAVAAHLDAEIMIMDEVLAVGDVKFQKKCLGRMDEAANTNGKTVLYVSHNMATVRQLCTRCIVLNHGKIVYDGDVETAISIYTEQGVEKGQRFYSLDIVKRPSLDHGLNFRIKELEFINHDIPVYSKGEIIRMRIRCHSAQQYENVGIYFTLLAGDDSPIGTTQSISCIDIAPNTDKDIIMEFSPSNLADGKYHFYLDVYYKNDYGTFSSIDHPLQKIFFEIKSDENDGIEWQNRYFGAVRLEELKLYAE